MGPSYPSFEGRSADAAAPIQQAMERLTVECLRCGATREVRGRDAGECERCEYVGWALAAELTEKLRQILRERPPERRRLHAA